LLFRWDNFIVLEIHEVAWSVEHETIMKSYTEYEISNAFDCTDDNGAF